MANKYTNETLKILQFNWNIRIKFCAEGDKLWAEGNKLYAEGSKLYAEGSKLYAEGNKLHAEGDKLYAEGDKLWAETILEFCGNIKMKWIWNNDKNDSDCELEDGTIFKA